VADLNPGDGNAEVLWRYWLHGKGNATKIMWRTPGDMRRCMFYLAKYLPPSQVAGYCAKMHREATGMWPGDKNNK